MTNGYVILSETKDLYASTWLRLRYVLEILRRDAPLNDKKRESLNDKKGNNNLW